MFALAQYSADRLYAIGEPPDYEPTADRTVAAIARERGEDVLTTMYDLMLEGDAATMLMLPMFNYSEGNHDAIREMMTHPAGVLGLSDGGAHCSMICDASYPTFLLTHWARDRHRGREAAAGVCRAQAVPRHRALFGLTDRGVIAVGKEGRPQRDRHRRAHAARAADGLRTCPPAGTGSYRARPVTAPPSSAAW